MRHLAGPAHFPRPRIVTSRESPYFSPSPHRSVLDLAFPADSVQLLTTMNIIKANQKYEAWLHTRIPLLQADLEHKHELMREAPFPFLRATFFRWAQTWPVVSPKSAAAPQVLGVGDLHVEN